MKIITVIVTHNRLPLLKKCIQAVSYQTRKPDQVIIINNGSTDGTQEYLKTLPFSTITQDNKGGASGFSTGIMKAYERGADWIWLMDDDTIAEPRALEHLLRALHTLEDYKNKIGFLSSKVLWTDGSIHKMNRTWPAHNQETHETFSIAQENGFSIIKFGTFVSMLLSAAAVEKAGLPIKEFFIWSDDIEYSKRLIANGFAGLAVPSSIIIHETPINYEGSVFRDQSKNLWKYKYGLRNELYTKRMHEGEKAFWKAWMWRMFMWPFLIFKERKNNRWNYLMIVWKTCFTALFFQPKIEMVSGHNSIRSIIVANVSKLKAATNI